MKKILMMLLLLVSTNVLAVDWVKVGGAVDGSVTTYVDPQSIRKDGNKVRLWDLKDYNSGQVIGNKTFLSTIMRGEYDCFEYTKRSIDLYIYTGHMGGGNIVFSEQNQTDPAISAPPGSDFENVLKIVCPTK